MVNDFMTVPQIAEELGVSRTSVYSWIREGLIKASVLPPGRKRKHYRIARADFDSFLERLVDRDVLDADERDQVGG